MIPASGDPKVVWSGRWFSVKHPFKYCGLLDQSLLVDSLSYFIFHPELHNWCDKDWYVLCILAH